MNEYIIQARAKDELRYYVYLHIRLDNNSIFYVGKGCGSRAWNKHGRNKYWNNIVNKHGYRVEILFDNLTEKESLDCEIDAISELTYFGIKLTNMSSGGESPKFSESSRLAMSKAGKGRRKTEDHKKKIADGNRGKKYPERSGENSKCADNKVYSFINILTKELFSGTRRSLALKYSLKTQLLNGLFLSSHPQKQSQGWGLFDELKSIDENIAHITTFRSKGSTEQYTFIRKIDGLIFKGSRLDLSVTYNINIDLIHALFCNNPRSSTNGWEVLNE